MTDEVHRRALARVVLTAVAKSRGNDDPLGSLAGAVLRGEADLRMALGVSWHGRALEDAFTVSLAERDAMSADERAEWQQQAQRLRDAGPAVTVDVDPWDGSTGDGREERR
ncbi:hypothetical protein AB0C22_26435 [Micromonospora sp. NPDC048894]|uniref:hypothetical protein n=1 Tax=Micromonospora sp. NPDC048894 TaxID=3155493 RepID=UPI003409C715